MTDAADFLQAFVKRTNWFIFQTEFHTRFVSLQCVLLEKSTIVTNDLFL